MLVCRCSVFVLYCLLCVACLALCSRVCFGLCVCVCVGVSVLFVACVEWVSGVAFDVCVLFGVCLVGVCSMLLLWLDCCVACVLFHLWRCDCVLMWFVLVALWVVC